MIGSESDAYFSQALAATPYLAILRGLDPDETVARCHAVWDAGLTLVEVPVHVPAALPSLTAAVRAARDRGREVGAGSVISAEQVREVQRVGAAFTVSPGLSAAVVEESLRAGLPHLPGVASGSDITAALGHGISWQKAFPADWLGVGWVAAMRAPFPQVCLVATGGVDSSNAGAFFAAGARAVAIGSALSRPGELAALTSPH